MSMMRCPKCDVYVDTDRTDPYWDLGGEPWHERCVDDLDDDEMIKYFGTTEPE